MWVSKALGKGSLRDCFCGGRKHIFMEWGSCTNPPPPVCYCVPCRNPHPCTHWANCTSDSFTCCQESSPSKGCDIWLCMSVFPLPLLPLLLLATGDRTEVDRGREGSGTVQRGQDTQNMGLTQLLCCSATETKAICTGTCITLQHEEKFPIFKINPLL